MNQNQRANGNERPAGNGQHDQGKGRSGRHENQAVYSTLIRDMATSDRPRERLRSSGAASLSNAELLAIQLATGRRGESVLNLATNMLATKDGLAGLAGASYTELCEFEGVSHAKACNILAALELGRRVHSLLPASRPRIHTPVDVWNLLGTKMAFEKEEHLRVILLNSKNEVLGYPEVYVGNVSASIVRVAELLRPAVMEKCPSIIAVHNHPSGDPTPSVEDILITRKIRAGAELIDLELLDHVIIGQGAHVSMKDRGLGFD